MIARQRGVISTMTRWVGRACHRVEDKLDVRVALVGGPGVAVGGLDPADLHVGHVADDLRSLLHLPAPCVPAGSKDGGERDRWIDLLGSRITVLQAVQCLNAGTPGISLHPAAVIDFEIVRIRSLRVCGNSKREAKTNARKVACDSVNLSGRNISR